MVIGFSSLGMQVNRKMMRSGIRYLGLNFDIPPDHLHNSMSFLTSTFFICQIVIITPQGIWVKIKYHFKNALLFQQAVMNLQELDTCSVNNMCTGST